MEDWKFNNITNLLAIITATVMVITSGIALCLFMLSVIVYKIKEILFLAKKSFNDPAFSNQNPSSTRRVIWQPHQQSTITYLPNSSIPTNKPSPEHVPKKQLELIDLPSAQILTPENRLKKIIILEDITL